MRKIKPAYIPVLILLLSVCTGLRSQQPFTGTVRERLQVCTDRTTYVAGEKILFSAVLFNPGDTVSTVLSQAFYGELITPHGERVTGRKYLLQNSAGEGCLTIPEETVSGIYYLKFYTRFMRNTGTDAYKYIMLKIINPYKTEVVSGNDVMDTTHRQSTGTDGNKAGFAVNFESGKRSFAARDDIRLTLAGSNGNDAPARVCLSVIPASTLEEHVSAKPVQLRDSGSTVYFPETRGISLSGQLIAKDSRKPVPGANVNLSIIGDRDILVVRTDSSGRFFFALPGYFGKMDIFLSADDLPEITPELLIDNDFCSRPVNLPFPPFSLDEAEQGVAYKLAVNARVHSVFRQDTLRADTTTAVNNVSFYGKPSEILLMAKFIDLPTLAEYFTELPGMVKLKKAHGKRQFRFYDAIDEMSVHGPLMLVDWVAVNDIEKILAMSPAEIDRIELVNAPYIKGNVTYGGIISFVSKKNNFAGIDLPTSGTFVNYMFLEDCTDPVAPDPPSARIPDARNTLYWNPDVRPDDKNAGAISFKAPDTPGKYWVVLRKMMKNGEVVSTREMITVTKQ